MPAWWLPGGHLQTLWPTLLRRRPRLELERRRIELPDGDFIDIDRLGSDGPTVVLVPGLEGSIRSPYARGMLARCRQLGWRGVLFHHRGCSGAPNRLARSYHSGDTGDLHFVLERLTSEKPQAPLAVVGFSLGGAIVLRWLAEERSRPIARAAVAVSVPFELDRAVERMSRGFSRLYQWRLLRALRRSVAAKQRAGIQGIPVTPRRIRSLRTLPAFDDAVTAPLHGFENARDYYRRASCRPRLPEIGVPTLILNARNDPLVGESSIPGPEEAPPGVTLEVTPGGGHIGFLAGEIPGMPRYWLEDRIPAFLSPYLESGHTSGAGS